MIDHPRICCTFPGRSGDLLWALPTVRALSEQQQTPVDLILAYEYRSLVPLLSQQAYLGAVIADPLWAVQQTAPMTPRTPATVGWGYDHVYHLGYEGWPELPLPYDTARRAGVEIDLARPWIDIQPYYPTPNSVAVGFTDEWFELKFGLWELLRHLNWRSVSGREGSRWQREGHHHTTDWMEAARSIAASRVFLGCCSALHVLACALGIPCVIVEPAEARHHPIFWPYDKVGPQVTLVTGGDGKPTWDARHTSDAVRDTLARLDQERG